MYCFDTDILSAVLKRDPPLHLLRRLARTPAPAQFTTAVTLGEMVYGAEKRGSPALRDRVRQLLQESLEVLPFDVPAAEVYGQVRPNSSRKVGGSTNPICGSPRSPSPEASRW